MPKMGGDDKDEKKEESAESKAEKEAAVGGVHLCRRMRQQYVQLFRKKLPQQRKKPWSRRERTCMTNRSWRGKKNEQNTEKRFDTYRL